MTEPAATPVALTIAGSDSGGGAGIQADLKTFSALGVYGASVITALTAQNTRGVSAVHSVPPEFVSAQIEAVATDLAIAAVKTGMLNDGATVRAVCEGVRRYALRPLVVDPVMVATSGDLLLAEDAVDAVRRELLPLADLATPNLPEAARLLDCEIAHDEDAMLAQGEALLQFGSRAVLIKGGHADGSDAVDFLVTRDAPPVRMSLPRLQTSNTHGTGCTLAAAIVAALTRGESLVNAVETAKQFVHEALASGAGLRIGHGAGPVDHLTRWRPRNRA